jgi:hypothetical protein
MELANNNQQKATPNYFVPDEVKRGIGIIGFKYEGV